MHYVHQQQARIAHLEVSRSGREMPPRRMLSKNQDISGLSDSFLCAFK